jgi:hypothetical protein
MLMSMAAKEKTSSRWTAWLAPILFLLAAVAAAGPASALTCGALETRAWEKTSAPLESRPVESLQLLNLHQQNESGGYDSALGSPLAAEGEPEPVQQQVQQPQSRQGGGMAAQARQNLQRMGLEDVDIGGQNSVNHTIKDLEAAGFKEARVNPDTGNPWTSGRRVWINPKTGAKVYYDTGEALIRNQVPHWEIEDSAGRNYRPNGRPVGPSDDPMGGKHIKQS